MRIPWTDDGAIEEECGIAAARLRAWADAEPFAARCEVVLTELEPRRLGAAALPRCRMRITGEHDDCLALYRRFFYQFMSAGG